MNKIFSIAGVNSCLTPVLRNFEQWRLVSPALNFRSMVAGWEVLDFRFDEERRTPGVVPDICPSYLPGMLLFRAELESAIFPNPRPEWEFLPIRVQGEDWRLLNCLTTTKAYNSTASKFIRGENGQICFIQHLVMTDPCVAAYELFSLEDSNRAELHCLPSFKERIEGLRLNGLSFNEIGHIEMKE